MNLLKILIIIHIQMIVVQKNINFDVHSYHFKIESKYKKEKHEYSCNPMMYHLLNDNDIYTHNPDIALNKKYYEKYIVIIKKLK